MEELLLVNGKGSSVELNLQDPLSGDWEVALWSLSTYYSWPNINNENNQLKYTVADGDQKTITLPVGCYEVKHISRYIKSALKQNGNEDAFALGINQNTLRAEITVKKDDCVVNMGASSIKGILGWVDEDLTKGVHSAARKVNITDVNEVLVHCNLVRGAYAPKNADRTTAVKSTVLTSFYPNVPPGYKIIVKPEKLFYAPTQIRVQRIKLWLTDQNYKLLENDETLTATLHLKTYNK